MTRISTDIAAVVASVLQEAASSVPLVHRLHSTHRQPSCECLFSNRLRRYLLASNSLGSSPWPMAHRVDLPPVSVAILQPKVQQMKHMQHVHLVFNSWEFRSVVLKETLWPPPRSAERHALSPETLRKLLVKLATETLRCWCCCCQWM